MKTIQHALAGGALCLLCPFIAQAHFGMVIPSTNNVTQDKREVSVELSFSHPMELIGMELTKPDKFYVVHQGKKDNLLDSLTPKKVMGHGGWQLEQKIKRPGVYQYVMEPSPYWEESEGLFIIHYTKTLVSAYGDDEGWDSPVGLPTEIVPRVRPFGNYAGNIFSGVVLVNGKPAPNTEVEVELYNTASALSAPTDHHITQVVKTDDNGGFSFVCPVAGWWGFSALSEADYTLKGPDNTDKNIELGAVLWVYFDSIK